MRNLTYTNLGIIAPEAVWRAAGAQPYSNSDEITQIQLGVSSCDLIHQLLLLGIHATGRRDEAAVVWAIAELQRRREETSRVTAQAREAEALQSLAAAIKEGTEEAVLERILGRLSERTQYAVRQQLKR